LHSFVSLIFAHFEKSERNPEEKTRGIAGKFEFFRNIVTRKENQEKFWREI
jgi:hypothetical protein